MTLYTRLERPTNSFKNIFVIGIILDIMSRIYNNLNGNIESSKLIFLYGLTPKPV